jgi:hypothetical protein
VGDSQRSCCYTYEFEFESFRALLEDVKKKLMVRGCREAAYSHCLYKST